jgi:prepilin-type processing-associated H-X9-DG protein
MGTTFSFADGHAEYKKWTNPHTLKVIKLDLNSGLNITPDIDNCDCDLRWYCKIVWGDIPAGYNCPGGLPPGCD